MQDLLWLLLPLAAAAGWFSARSSKGKAGRCADSILGPEYIKGLNYLLNEQQDKAIDVFIRMLEVNSDTVETHLALGNLFRKRGEVDRAIRIHQNLAARPGLQDEQRMDALLELGQDYMKAGLFDRAEGLFRELNDNNVHLSSVLPLLLDIYQQEKDWQNAISIAGQMGFVGEQSARAVIAQFCCELAENARATEDIDAALKYLDEAGKYHPHCARARLIRASIARQQGDCEAALKAYVQVVEMDIDLLPVVLDDMHACHAELGTLPAMIGFLRNTIPKYAGISPVLKLADIVAEEQGEQMAAAFIAGELGLRPSVRGLSRFIDFSLAGSDGAARENLMILKNMTDQLLENKPVYACANCGFSGKTLHWNCPGCRQWNTIKPIHGVEAD
ncbi:MAG: lipopolysaccharide assembly protein LapB [Gammaproteobacteria bacterium]|nr:lipopolysaccharide assembly protein LapB [Gammaproteobacteria bacterium]MDH5513602.1 lipopolysaccharide assembly protein LapB [Gammaproteobacteria bacterium]